MFQFVQRVKQRFSHKGYIPIASAALTASALAVTAGAEGNNDSTAYQSVIETINGTLSNTNIVTVLSYAVGIAVVMVFTWWAVRKVTGIIKRAFMRGKLRL